jgi:hypothetical protein
MQPDGPYVKFEIPLRELLVSGRKSLLNSLNLPGNSLQQIQRLKQNLKEHNPQQKVKKIPDYAELHPPPIFPTFSIIL